MAILVDTTTKVIVQGFTGREGTFHAQQMIEYGTQVVGGVRPGAGGTMHLDRPVFDSVGEAVEATGANTSIIFVPAGVAADAIMEAADAGVKLIVTITEGIPVHDMVKVKAYLKEKGVRMIGPNCPGVITVGEAKVGIMPGFIHRRGRVGVVSRSGTLTYEAVWQLTQLGLGQSTCVGIGGDPILGSSMLEIVQLFMDDEETEAVVMIGEIGGTMEIEVADWYRSNARKPIVAFIAGETAPPGRRMGHAGAIVGSALESAQAKMAYLQEAGIYVVKNPAQIGHLVREVM